MQDIAVDGWALTILRKENVGYAATTNAMGQTLGYATWPKKSSACSDEGHMLLSYASYGTLL